MSRCRRPPHSSIKMNQCLLKLRMLSRLCIPKCLFFSFLFPSLFMLPFLISSRPFSLKVDEYAMLDGVDAVGQRFVKPSTFSPKHVPLFLEGPTRQMKTLDTYEEKKAVYEMVKASPMRDKELGMYAISESLKGMSFEVQLSSF